MKATQDNRMMRISTPLGADHLLINKLSAAEGLSELFTFNVELLHDEEVEGDVPTIIDVKSVLGQKMSVAVTQTNGTTRYFNGIVNSFSQGNRNGRFSYYYATLVPHAWILTQKSQSRIYQQMNVVDIIKKVFADAKIIDVTFKTQGTYEERNYCVQYRETDFAFISRLMEEEGIYYYFEHKNDGTHKMIIGDKPQSHPNCPSQHKIPFMLNISEKEEFVSAVATWRADYKMQTGTVRLTDYHFEMPKKNLLVEELTRTGMNAYKDLEIYDFPGGAARKFDENAAGKVLNHNTATAKIRMEEIDAQFKIFSGISDCCSLTAGYRFELENHPNPEFNAQHTLVSVSHEIEQSPDYISDEEVSNSYGNSFRCIPNSVAFRPPQTTPKPLMQGSQTAFVVGPSGEEIYTDKHGRVKVQFHWDRHGKYNETSSCWIRVAQTWAGKKWGMMFIPRIGMEVKVDFFEGDPDQPIITGCVYNAEAVPPYDLPGEKTKSTIKSDSSTGGGGFNEIRLEDKKGSEQIFIHGEKNIDVRIKNDSLEHIGNDRHLIVIKDKLEKVGGDKHLQVIGDKNEKVDGTVSLNAGQDLQEKVGMKYGLDSGQEVHIKAGVNMVLESGTNLTLKVGGNFININPAGVFIKGTLVFINSGGSAGSGSGASPETPKAPKEADQANPGEKLQLPSPKPPPKPLTYSPAAIVMMNAAKNATPFCEICARS